VHHHPAGPWPFTVQIGDPNTVAALTGITTVADLRRYDMALGGQGAPLVPAFHNWLLRSPSERRVVVNIGGIANITTLMPEEPILGGDTGPGNTLLDGWIERHRGYPYDAHGRWAAEGRISESLLGRLLDAPWFGRPMPKSTGRELFNLQWLDGHLDAMGGGLRPADVQATLTELTAVSISRAVCEAAPGCERLIVCGGGACNGHLMERLRTHGRYCVDSSLEHGAAPEWIEGMAFAWLARARIVGIPGNVPSVTGAREEAILGGIYSGHRRP
jgi:anhydro-N-acetylmuramic acid kinase